MQGPPQSDEPGRGVLGLFGRPEAPPRITVTEVIAAALSGLWLIGAAVVVLLAPGADVAAGRLRPLILLIIVVMPLALIWVAAIAARSARVMREETARLQVAIDAMRHAYLAQAQAGGGALRQAAIAAPRPPEAAAASTSASPATGRASLRSAAARPATPEPSAPAGEQGQLALDAPAAAAPPPLPLGDFIRALNFPDSAEDHDGIAALRRALADRRAARLIQASQDVLTLLGQEGVYMDDLAPDRARPELWRRFAAGERGRTVAGVGGLRDGAALDRIAARMRQDPVFRDAAHHFLRRFDHTFAELEAGASDADIAALADTRTARAFMLLGRTAGTFD